MFGGGPTQAAGQWLVWSPKWGWAGCFFSRTLPLYHLFASSLLSHKKQSKPHWNQPKTHWMHCKSSEALFAFVCFGCRIWGIIQCLARTVPGIPRCHCGRGAFFVGLIVPPASGLHRFRLFSTAGVVRGAAFAGLLAPPAVRIYHLGQAVCFRKP